MISRPNFLATASAPPALAVRFISTSTSLAIICGALTSTAIGGLAFAGIPVTHRDVNQAVTFLTGHDQSGLAPSEINWTALSQASPVLVIYMAIKHLPQISGALLAAGRDPDEPVAIVSNATLPDMKVLETRLATAANDAVEHGMQAPAIVCIGHVVRMRQAIDWMSQLNGFPPRDPDPFGQAMPSQAT